MEIPEQTSLSKKIDSISTNISAISWIILFMFIAIIFSSNKVFVSNEVEVREQDISTDNVKQPKTYCSEDGILYWINGIVTIDSQKQYVLNVVYDTNQKPKKCK